MRRGEAEAEAEAEAGEEGVMYNGMEVVAISQVVEVRSSDKVGVGI